MTIVCVTIRCGEDIHSDHCMCNNTMPNIHSHHGMCNNTMQDIHSHHGMCNNTMLEGYTFSPLLCVIFLTIQQHYSTRYLFN